jgi:hypothetical protein
MGSLSGSPVERIFQSSDRPLRRATYQIMRFKWHDIGIGILILTWGRGICWPIFFSRRSSILRSRLSLARRAVLDFPISKKAMQILHNSTSN